MRSLALTAILGSLVASTGLVAQSLTEHAAAAAGATIGTAAGKPLGTALGKVFGDVEKATPTAPSKAAKPVVKPAAAAPETTANVPVASLTVVGGGDGSAVASGGGSSHRSARRRGRVVESEAVAAAPITPIVVPVVAQVVVKEPTAQDVASIQVGATASEMTASGTCIEVMV